MASSPTWEDLDGQRQPWTLSVGCLLAISGMWSRVGMRLKWIPGGAAFLSILMALATPSKAQRSDSFEGDTPRWRLVASDCDARLTEHEISTVMPRGGRACELFEVTCTSGQEALMAYPIEPTAVLNEFQPSLWVRCAAGNIRLGVRVVFPNAVHPVSRNRLTAVVWGDKYDQTGRWQLLQVGRIEEQLQQEIVAIRQQFDSPTNLEQPQIDALVLNVYTGPGRYRVQVDDLELAGMIPLASVGVPLPANWRESWRWAETVEIPFGSNSTFPVWLQHRGEEPAWVSSLGFNGLWLADIPTPQQLSQIAEARLAVYSPPPLHPIEFDQQQLSALQGWVVGVALNREQMELAKRNIAVAEQLPISLRRPLVGEALEHYWLYGRMIHRTVVPYPEPASAGDTTSKRAWLTSTLQSLQVRSDQWVSIHAGLSPPIVEQCRAASNRIDGEQGSAPVSRSTFSPLGFRHEVAGAVMSGAEGILFRTHAPLVDPINTPLAEDRALLATIRWCGNDLRLWSPWLTKGQTMPPPSVGRTDYAAVRWRVKDADLILVQNVSPEAHWCLPATRNEPLVVQMNEGTDTPQVIRITEGTMELMSLKATAGSQEWQVARPAALEVFLLTRNPQVLGYVRRRLAAKATEYATDQMEIASYCAEQATQLFDARFAPSASLSSQDRRASAAQQQQLGAIQSRLEQGWRALESRQPQAATVSALEVFDLAQSMMHDAFMVATRSLATPQSSPFVLNPGTLQYHWMVAEACALSQWQSLQIPGSEFSDLTEMLKSGWTQQRRLQDLADLRVELVPGTSDYPQSLRLAAYSKTSSVPESLAAPDSPDRNSLGQRASGVSAQSIPGGYEGASLRVRSAGFPVKKGQFVRITAVAFLRHISQDPASGVLFYDNQAGPSLGQLVRGVPGQRVPIELYRFVIADGEFRVLAECRGECDVQIQNLAASIIEPATARRSFVTAPIDDISQPFYSEQPINAQP